MQRKRNSSQPTDVYIAYEHRDENLAEKVADVLQSYGLSVSRGINETGGTATEDSVWEAMAESRAVIAIVPDDASSSWISFELGAASAWNKSIYALTSQPTAPKIPGVRRNVKTYPIGRIDEVAQLILRSSQTISDDEAEQLSACYSKVGIPADQLALQPNALAKIVREFNQKTKRQMSGEEVLSTLLRLRKRRALPRLATRSPSKRKAKTPS